MTCHELVSTVTGRVVGYVCTGIDESAPEVGLQEATDDEGNPLGLVGETPVLSGRLVEGDPPVVGV